MLLYANEGHAGPGKVSKRICINTEFFADGKYGDFGRV